MAELAERTGQTSRNVHPGLAVRRVWQKLRRRKTEVSEPAQPEAPTILDGDAVPLHQLLSVATLSPAQAALLARDVASGIRAAQPPGGTHTLGIDGSSLRLTRSGHVSFAPMWDGENAGRAPEQAGAIVAKLVANARQAGPARQEAAARLQTLVAANGDVAALARAADEVAGELLDGLATHRVRQVRRSLGALAVASQGLDDVNGDGAAPGGSDEDNQIVPQLRRPSVTPVVLPRVPTAPRGRVPRRRVYHRRRRVGVGRILLAVLLMAALAALAWWAAPRLWAEVQDSWDELFGTEDPPPVEIEPVQPPPEDEDEDGGSDEEETSASEDDPDEPADVEAPAPESAGAVDAVRLDGDCEPGNACAVRVEIDLEAASSSRDVTWEFHVIDRCGDDVETVTGVTVTAQPGWTQVWGSSQLDLPDGAALAVLAVTESPDEAASPAMLVPEDADTC